MSGFVHLDGAPPSSYIDTTPFPLFGSPHVHRHLLATALPLAVAAALSLGPAANSSAEASEPASDPALHPLATCAVSGTPLGDDTVSLRHDGRELRFCAEACKEQFGADPSAHLAALDARLLADQDALYPLETCVVSGQPLTAQGEPFAFLHGNRLVKLCCEGCRGGFEKDPTKHLATLDAAAIADQVGDYPLDTCAVTGMQLGGMGAPDDYVLGGRLVRLCCAGCRPAVADDPAAVRNRLAEARRAREAAGAQGSDDADANDPAEGTGEGGDR